MDLTTRPPNSLDISQPPSSPSTPIASTNGLGDLRSISRKAWSRSADDLGSLSYSPVSPAFQERVAQYRGRSNSNTGPQPFPTSPQPFPSTEPQSPHAPTVTVSPPEPPLHIHTRSHSFGPKLASKRAIPPSPKRKGSGPPSVPLPSPMLDTPAPEPKRASQIVHNTGYVSLAKAWKPYKLEMKGPKLYFYKPPGERSAQLRGMFPTGIEDEEEEALPPPSPRLPGKKRAYWGKTTHPDLAKDASEGTFEALIHESVFGHREDIWKNSVLLALPSLVGKDKFEAELGRWEEGATLMEEYRALHPPEPKEDDSEWAEPPSDPHIVARTLTSFHRSVLPLELTASLPDAFFGSDTHPHWLTRYVLTQVLQTDKRVEAITLWIRVGELCRLDGDECSWAAIRAALCCPPVARLEKAWKRIDTSAVEAWASGQGGIVQPRLTPWGGDLKTRLEKHISQSRNPDKDDVYAVAPLQESWTLFKQCHDVFEGCTRSLEDLSTDERRIVEYWKFASRGGFPSKFERIDQFMSLSLAAEPRRRGLFEPYFWSRASSHYPPNASLIPLLFPEALPTVTLVDRAAVLRGRLDSDTIDIQGLRSVDGRLKQEDRRTPRQFGLDAGNLAALSQGGTVIPVHDGELLLIVSSSSLDSAPNSRPASRPPSASINETSALGLGRAPSIRVKPGTSQGLDRKSSIAKRSSLPALSSRQAYVTMESFSERPLRVLVQAGTIDRLVELLVHGLENISVSVADDNGEMSLREGTRELVVDRREFANIWWNVFRSFVTPFVFFELLKKMYFKNPSAKKEVLDAIIDWLASGNGGLDILDDTQLYQSFQVFVDGPQMETNDAALRSTWEDLKSTYKRETMRPSLSKVVHPTTPSPRPSATPSPKPSATPRSRNTSTVEPPDLDRIKPEELIEILDGMASATFSNVTEEDLYITSDLLETQSADRTGWFSTPREGEEVEIQTIYTHVHEVAPSSHITELGLDSLYRLLPPGVRGCIRGYSILRKWLVGQVTAKGLGLQRRQGRIEFLLRCIELCRGGVVGEKRVRSFVESVISSALMSVESRMFVRAWQGVAQSRGTQCDSLASLLARMAENEREGALTVDMGWVLERLLDVISTPDVVESTTDGQSLVNFDKRRHLCNLITTTPPPRNSEVTRRGFERLNNIEREVLALQLDHRSLREDALREAAGKKLTRPFPFQRAVQTQNDKHRRDRNWRLRLQKEKQLEQSKNEKRGEVLSKAMQRGHRNKKSMSSAFLHFMRPISSAFVSDTMSGATTEWTPTGKPTLVLSLTDARVRPVVNPERSWTFEIHTEDGGHYVVQAVNRAEMTKWLEVIGRVTSLAAKRRLTYVASKPDVQIDGKSSTASSVVVANTEPIHLVFGVDLQTLMEREAGGTDILAGSIPRVIYECLTEVEARGLTEVGIYRIAGATSEINNLKEAFNKGQSPISESTDIHAICDIVKSWFRGLPEPLFPPIYYRQIIEATKIDDLETRLSEYHRVIQELPQVNADLLKRMVEHLDKVADYEEYNQMTAEALAIVFSPNLLRTADFGLLLSNMGHSNKLVKALITQFHAIFDESDSADEEADSPVLGDLEEEDDDDDGRLEAD
ncbi:hypothetical protein CPB85DRAFT_1211957 [Mucidula mucida]|nr:hypothetical protein CPB85DRAFT_1211957 [Mucidula mucida]